MSAALLLSNHTLRELDISRNRIGSEGTQALMKSMWHNQALTELNLQVDILKSQRTPRFTMLNDYTADF